MAYFSNGSEGMAWQERNCDRCVNYLDNGDGRGPGCPIWDVHMIHNYTDVNEKESVAARHLDPPGPEDRPGMGARGPTAREVAQPPLGPLVL